MGVLVGQTDPDPVTRTNGFPRVVLEASSTSLMLDVPSQFVFDSRRAPLTIARAVSLQSMLSLLEHLREDEGPAIV